MLEKILFKRKSLRFCAKQILKNKFSKKKFNQVLDRKAF
jgi:hypothetical protein